MMKCQTLCECQETWRRQSRGHSALNNTDEHLEDDRMTLRTVQMTWCFLVFAINLFLADSRDQRDVSKYSVSGAFMCPSQLHPPQQTMKEKHRIGELMTKSMSHLENVNTQTPQSPPLITKTNVYLYSFLQLRSSWERKKKWTQTIYCIWCVLWIVGISSHSQ